MDRLKHLIYDYLIESGTAISTAKILNMLVLFLLAALTIYIIETIIRKIILIISAQIASKTNTDFDDILIANKLPRNISHIVPLMLIGKFTPIVFTDFRTVFDEVTILVQAAAVILTLWIVRSLLNSIKDYLKTIPNFKDKPIDSYIQVFMIFAWVVGLILVFAIVTGIPIQRFLVGMGTASAVILLIFKDTILGFVASIQVSINDMVRIGDWITFVKYGADGDVVEINLATVKVQNFDKTITTIPTYALISDSFKNWRGMSDSGGRRIKRALSIKLSSVKYLSINEVNELKKIDLISSYLETRQNDIERFNSKNDINKTHLINGRNLTNLGVFRKYMESYLENHSGTNKEMMIMVRQLAPTAQGIPLEVYAFSADKRWQNYEYIMADIFDHAIAATQYFDLEIFELPNNTSFKA